MTIQVGGFTFVPYKWRGKTYKTLTGLNRAVFKAYPGCRIHFTKDAMHVLWRDGRRKLFEVVRNHPAANEVANAPFREEEA